MIVEDETLIRKGLALAVSWELFGCEVVGEAENGEEGLKLIQRIQPDLVITDVRMPKMDGIEMIRQAQKISQAEYIILSGYSEFQYAQQAVKLGVKDYLLKPVDDQEFNETIKRVVQYILSKKKKQAIKIQKDIFYEYTIDQYASGKRKYVVDAVRYIKKHYQKDINIKQVADELEISESYLSRIFKKETNYTFVDYLTYYRIKKSMELLQDYKVKIYEVSDLVGYKDSHYFSSLFKKIVGVTPTEFRDGIIL